MSANRTMSILAYAILCMYILHVSSHVVFSFDSEKEETENDVKNEDDFYMAKEDGHSQHSQAKNADRDESVRLHDELGYHYHLPEQTTFDSREEQVTSKVLSTSPPQLTIMPSSVKETNCHTKDMKSSPSEDTGKLKRFDECLSETSTSDYVMSHVLKPSTSISENVLTMSGRVETQSRTDAIHEDATPVQLLSHPSTTFVLGS